VRGNVNDIDRVKGANRVRKQEGVASGGTEGVPLTVTHGDHDEKCECDDDTDKNVLDLEHNFLNVVKEVVDDRVVGAEGELLLLGNREDGAVELVGAQSAVDLVLRKVSHPFGTIRQGVLHSRSTTGRESGWHLRQPS